MGLFVALVGLGYLCRQHQDNGLLRFIGTCLSIYAVIKIVLLLAKAIKAARHVVRHGVRAEDADAVIKRAMPGWITGYYEVEKLIYRSFFDALRFAPARKADAAGATGIAGAHGAFGIDAGPRGMLRGLPMALLAVLGLSLWGAAHYFALGLWWQIGFVALWVYAGIWVVGDGNALRGSVATVTADGLDINIGVRKRIRLAWHGVAAIVPAKDAPGPDRVLHLSAGRSEGSVRITFKAGYHPDVIRFGYEVPSSYTSLTLSLRDAQHFMGSARPRMQ
ncbi:MAG: hypothetical protein ABW069_06295 [Duganella sp.]